MVPENPQTQVPIVDNNYEITKSKFVADARSQFQTLQGEIAARNKRIQENDAYIYGDLLPRMLDVPIGHDRTSVNWLRRTVEIHKTQFMGNGFSLSSTYNTDDLDSTDDPNEQARLQIINKKRQAFAEQRQELIESIMRDNGGVSFWMQAAENASAIGDSIVKGWYDSDQGKYCWQLVEAVEHCYALWKKDNFREFEAFAYVYQVSKPVAISDYNAPDDVPTSPLGRPLAIMSSANSLEYISTQPMVTIMEVTGKIAGWRTDGRGMLEECARGQETELNAIIVGNNVYQLIDDPKKLPKYYILPNKRMRRRPWGLPDVTEQSIQINLTYIETLSDWRTLASKVNFPKFKYFGFPAGIQLPKPKARTVEAIPLADNQDIQELGMANGTAQLDFQRQCEEIKSEFVREVGVGRVLFDDPDLPMASSAAMKTAMSSISDITEAKRELWTPVILKMFDDALQTLSHYDDSIKELVSTDTDENWHFRIQWPSWLSKDDPTYQAMQMNQFNAGALSIQTYLENMGMTKEELDRIREEMQDPLLGAIHAHSLGMYMEYKFFPPSSSPPKVNLNLRGDMTPEQEGNLAYQHGFNQGPFGTTAGPQGNQGLGAEDQQINQGYLNKPGQGPTAIDQSPGGGQVAYPGASLAAPPQGGQPSPVTTPQQNTPGSQPVSQPGSGAPAVSPAGSANQKRQRNRG